LSDQKTVLAAAARHNHFDSKYSRALTHFLEKGAMSKKKASVANNNHISSRDALFAHHAEGLVDP
jgi:hypothetical protein